MKFTTQELRDIYYEAEARSENKDYAIIAQKVYRVLTGKTKFCKFQLFENDLIACCFEEEDLSGDIFKEANYGKHESLVKKLYE